MKLILFLLLVILVNSRYIGTLVPSNDILLLVAPDNTCMYLIKKTINSYHNVEFEYARSWWVAVNGARIIDYHYLLPMWQALINSNIYHEYTQNTKCNNFSETLLRELSSAGTDDINSKYYEMYKEYLINFGYTPNEKISVPNDYSILLYNIYNKYKSYGVTRTDQQSSTIQQSQTITHSQIYTKPNNVTHTSSPSIIFNNNTNVLNNTNETKTTFFIVIICCSIALCIIIGIIVYVTKFRTNNAPNNAPNNASNNAPNNTPNNTPPHVINIIDVASTNFDTAENDCCVICHDRRAVLKFIWCKCKMNKLFCEECIIKLNANICPVCNARK